MIHLYESVLQYMESHYLNLIATGVFLLAGFFIANFFQRKTRARLEKRSPNHLTANFTSQLIGFTLKTIVVFTALYLLGLNSFTNKLLAGAGLLTFVIGFALKDIGENFLAGIILAFKSPFRLDDIIEVNGIIGHVKDISIRETLVKTPDGKDVFIPNSIILKSPLYNFTLDGFLRYEFTIGIAYENDPTTAIQVIMKTVKNREGILAGDKEPTVAIQELGTNTININVRFWIDTFASTKRSLHNTFRSQVINDVVAALQSKGFSLPSNIVEIKNYNTEEPVALKVEK